MGQLEQAAQAAQAAQAPGAVSPLTQRGNDKRDRRRGNLAAPVRKDLVDMNRPDSPQRGKEIADDVARRSGGLMGEEQEASPEEQQEYERVMQVLSKVLYEDDNTSGAIVDQLRPEEKVGSVAKAGILLIKQIDEKIDMDEVVIPQVTMEAADRLIDLYENAHGDEFSEEEAQQAFGATWEGVMQVFGVDEASYAELTQGMSEEDMSAQEQQYKQFLGE